MISKGNCHLIRYLFRIQRCACYGDVLFSVIHIICSFIKRKHSDEGLLPYNLELNIYILTTRPHIFLLPNYTTITAM